MGLISILLPIVMVNIIGGVMYGYAIGFVGVYNTFNNINTNCSALESEVACHSVHHADCVWGAFDVVGVNASEAACYFSDIRDGLVCAVYSNSSGACGDHSGCVYNHDSDVCEHAAGWSATEVGIFAGAMIVGGMIGSFGAPPFLARFGRKRPILITGLIAVMASVLMAASRPANSYGLMIFARVLLGVASGVTCVVCPMYVNEMTPEEHKGPAGVLFQIGVTFGIVLAAFVGLVIQPTDFHADLAMEMRFQVFINLQTFLAGLMVVLGAVMKESDKASSPGASDDTSNASGGDAADDLQLQGGPRESYSWGDMKVPLLGTFFIAVTLQLTGINAVMNYAPMITSAAGLSPLLGNFVVMAWNFVTTLISIPLSSRIPLRRLFLCGTVVASGACLMTGIPVYPGVLESDGPRKIIVGIGIIIFIAAFEIAIGPAFYVLAQEMFPPSFRGKGSSFAVVTQFIFNIIINVCFPIAVSGLSGGPSGNQNKGMSIVFMFFGSCGVVAFVFLFKLLHPYQAGSSYGYIAVD